MAKKAAGSAKKKGVSKQVAPRKPVAKAKPAKRPVRRPKAPSKTVVKRASARKVAAPAKRKKAAHKIETLDLSAFPPEAVTQEEKRLCLACVLDAFLRHMGLGPKTAYSEIRKYAPSVAELTATTITRPYFIASDPDDHCPYCGSASKWHAKLLIYRIESGWEVDHGRLFLAPVLFDELLLVQYLISRSHRAGGLTLEGRYTLQELFHRLRGSGYLRAIGVQAQNPSDAFEQLLAYLSG